MSWVWEVSLCGDPASADALWIWFNANLAKPWAGLHGLSALDAYRPARESARDPFNDDRNGPLLIVMPEFGSSGSLIAARPAIEQSLAGLPDGIAVTVTGFERKLYAIDGKVDPLRAPFSYVVRYHRPAEDEAAFVANYIATHPGTLATLPKIRSVMCYFPVQSQGRWPDADYMIGNEVVFDSIADFNAAMQSSVRQELRRHFREFPKFTGLNTHFPMDRTRLAG